MTEPVMVGGAAAETNNRRALLMLGAAAVVLVLVALVLPKVLFGSDDVAVDDFPVAPATPIAPAEVVTGEPAVEDGTSFQVYTTRNPFTPLVDLTAAPAAGTTDPLVAEGTTAPPVVGSSAAPTVVGSSSPAPAPAPAPTTVPRPTTTVPRPTTTTVPSTPAKGTSGSTVTEPRVAQRVALLEVFVDGGGFTVASVRVNDTVYRVATSATFSTRYKVVSLSVADGCGEFLYGDTPFRLCEGDELLK